ncbi:MAG: helix-turn-helix domain-containing protein [Candidatus Eisenbacteria sp.]|nr:helix-turn-helix domain-containing protein [Candidatus Eisenbacteria bacterium]
MESVGELLKHEREAQGKSIEDVAKATKMSRLILEALEADHFSVMPAPVYVKGHLRTYARFLGLSEDAIVDKYLRFTQQQGSEELDEWDAVELELHEERRRVGRRWVWVAVAVAVVIVAVIGWRAVSQRGRAPEPETNTSTRTSTNIPAAVTEPVRGTVAEDTMIEWHKLELLAVAKERTWLSVSIDGEPVADLTLERGEQRRWDADEFFQLDVGNGGGLELYLDGKLLGTAGSGPRLVEGLVVNESGMSR